MYLIRANIRSLFVDMFDCVAKRDNVAGPIEKSKSRGRKQTYSYNINGYSVYII